MVCHQIWFVNVPHTRLAAYKGKQNWVKVYDRYLTFPGGGTQFKFGALHYIDYLQQVIPFLCLVLSCYHIHNSAKTTRVLVILRSFESS